MPTPRPTYLHRCFEAFAAISAKIYGTPFDLPAIERAVKHLQRNTPLTYQDLRYFESPDHWWFKQFWLFPPEHDVAPALNSRTFNFWQLQDGNERATITALLDIFRSVDLVSIILRFIRPDRYGILSPPVERVLDVRRCSDGVETYMNYLSNLRAIRQQYGFTRAADADMALWVLHERCFGGLRDQEVARAYASDSFMLQLRARNLVAPLAELAAPRLAQALQGVKPDLAALVACHALEIQLRELATNHGVAGRNLDELIRALPRYGGIDRLRKASGNGSARFATISSTAAIFRHRSRPRISSRRSYDSKPTC